MGPFVWNLGKALGALPSLTTRKRGDSETKKSQTSHTESSRKESKGNKNKPKQPMKDRLSIENCKKSLRSTCMENNFRGSTFKNCSAMSF